MMFYSAMALCNNTRLKEYSLEAQKCLALEGNIEISVSFAILVIIKSGRIWRRVY